MSLDTNLSQLHPEIAFEFTRCLTVLEEARGRFGKDSESDVTTAGF